MNDCPHRKRIVNPDGTTTCLHCGRVLAGQPSLLDD